MSWRESSAIGILMNTRGLMELVILNIGLELRRHHAGNLCHDGDHGAGHDRADDSGASAHRYDAECSAGRKSDWPRNAADSQS